MGSIPTYSRQFLGQMDKPDLDSIDGLSPAVSIDQKTTSRNPRSTVGTVTEIYDYLRLLYARMGTPHCPECGRIIERQTTDQVADKILEAGQGRRAYVLAPVVLGRKGEYVKLFEDLRKEADRKFYENEKAKIKREVSQHAKDEKNNLAGFSNSASTTCNNLINYQWRLSNICECECCLCTGLSSEKVPKS